MSEAGGGASKVDARALKERVLATFRSPQYKPPVLPAVATELLALTRRSDVGVVDVTRTLERDPILAAAVLKLAQSPLYATRIPPTSLSQAVQRLGVVTVRDMVFQVVMDLRVFRVEGYKDLMERVRRHSIVTAHLMRVLCTHAPLPADQAFLCGLLHDVGLGAVLLAIGELPQAQRPELTAMATVAADVHHEVGAMMTRFWQLAPELQTVVEHHHDYDPRHTNNALVAALVAAESLADDLGFCVNDVHTMQNDMAIASSILDRVPHPDVPLAFKQLGISPTLRDTIRREAATIPQRAFS